MTFRWILIVCLTFMVKSTIGQDSPDTATPATDVQKIDLPASSESADSETNPAERPKIDPEKKRKATILMAAISGIAICGVGVIAATMLMAKHLRRVARDPGPAQRTAGNDFWFLKPPKQTVSDLNVAESHQPPRPPPNTESKEAE